MVCHVNLLAVTGFLELFQAARASNKSADRSHCWPNDVAAMAYILAINPQILSTTGMDFGAVVTATALASAIMTTAFALLTNWPIALAPGMGRAFYRVRVFP